VGITNAVNIDWWGAVEADPQNPVNNWWRIAWAANKADELYQNNSYEWTYIDIPGHYYYRYTVRIPEGVKLRGASTQTYGSASNGQQTYGKLTLMPGEAMSHITPGFGDDKVVDEFRMDAIDLTHGYMVKKFGVESLEIDGNIDGNHKVFENVDGKYGGVQKKLQNGNQWNGIMSRPTEPWSLPEGGVSAELIDTYIHSFPGNGISGNWRKLDFSPSENVRVGAAPRNHQLYRTMGLHDGWTIEGAGWASLIKVIGASFNDLTVKPSPNELYDEWGVSWKIVFGHHAKGFGADWSNFGNSPDLTHIDVDNFTVDLTNAPTDGRYPSIFLFKARGYGGSYTNGTVLTPPSKSMEFFRATSTNGNGPARGYKIQDVTVTDQGGGVTAVGGDAFTHVVLDNVTIESDRSTTPNLKLFNLQSFGPGTYAEYNGDTVARPMPMAARLDVTNLQTQPRRGNPFRVWNMNGEHPMNVFVSGSVIDNSPADRSSRFFGPANGDRSVFVDVFRLYLNETAINAREPEPDYRDLAFHRYLLNPEKTLRLRNCTSPRTDRVSDASGTYTSGTGDEGNSYVLIPTSLMSLAQETDATVTSGNRTVQSVENVDANGNVLTWDPSNPQAFDPRDPYLRVNLDGPIQSGNTITIDWTARVTPTADYQPTGVFVARPVANQSYTSGNGPFTIDLRGVASSQETQDPVRYSASSSDASVVTTSVNSYQDTDDNQIPWELELTRQGTGTATITVTATIDGVGTATDTFEVTIE
jgi:hypothetical protein